MQVLTGVCLHWVTAYCRRLNPLLLILTLRQGLATAGNRAAAGFGVPNTALPCHDTSFVRGLGWPDREVVRGCFAMLLLAHSSRATEQ